MQHWAEEVPRHTSEDGKTKVTIWAGSYAGQQALTPPPDSWASRPDSNVGIWHVTLRPGGVFTLPGVDTTKAVNRVAYFLEGSGLQINAETVRSFSAATLRAADTAEFTNPSTTEVLEFLVLQGSPIGEPVAQHGPFVMNTREEIQQAFLDYQRTQFGGWPWPEDAMVFPREKGRFSLVEGVEHLPPTAGSTINVDGMSK